MPTDSARKHVLVAGATGRLGQLVNVLLARGHTVRAMTRDPGSDAAARLRDAGASIVVGDFDDGASLAIAALGMDAVFATGTAHRAGPEGELRHGTNVVAAVAAAGVRHLVYCSGEGAAADSPLPLFRVKHQVEQQIRSLPLAHTILAPVYFMENLFNPWNLPVLRAGIFPSPIAVDAPLQQAAIADVAGLAALAIEQPEEFAGQRIAIASDELTAAQAADAASDITGRTYAPDRLETSVLGPGAHALFAWLEQSPPSVDVPAVHSRYADLNWHTYERWLALARSATQKAVPARACPRGLEEHAAG
jgi:uncharacterized protein YbjT (DUF2867 family)